MSDNSGGWVMCPTCHVNLLFDKHSPKCRIGNLERELAAEKEHHACTIDVLEQTRRELAALKADAERLDALEAEANAEPLLLHEGYAIDFRGFRGLGLRGLNRTLRMAIDQMRGYVTLEPTTPEAK